MHHLLTKIQTYTYYAFVFLLPWQTLYILREIYYGTDKWHYGTIGIYASDIFLFTWIILSLYLYKDRIIAWILAHKRPFFAISLCYFWILASIYWSQDHILALYHATLIGCAWMIALLSWIIPLHKKTATIIFIASACIHALIGITQFLLQKTVSSSFLGMQDHDIIWGGTATITAHGERWLRAYGGLPHPNMLGGILCIAFLLTFTRYVVSTHRTFMTKIFSLIAVTLFTMGIIVTFSRTTWVAMIIGILLLSFYHVLYTQKFVQKIMPLYTLSLGIIFLFLVILGYAFTSRITNDTRPEHNSINDRRSYLMHAHAVLQEHFLLGTGIGNYTNTAHVLFPHVAIWKVQPVHNAFILSLVEIGSIGTLLILYALYHTMNTVNFTRILKDPLSTTAFVSIFLLACTAFFDHWLWSSHVGILLMTFLVCLIAPQKNDMY